MVITGRLVLLLAVGAVLTTVSALAAIVWAGLLAVGTMADLALAGAIGALRLVREPTAPVRLGAAEQTVLVIAQTGRRTARLTVRDAWVPSAGASPPRQRVTIRAGERRRVTTALRPTRRGLRSAATVTLRSSGPLGLAARQRGVAVPGSVTVLPRFASRRFLPEKLSRLRQLDGVVLVQQRGAGTEFDALRSYVPGDDVRAIDWRATARGTDPSGDLVVRTWRPERDRLVVLALDTGRSAAVRLGDEPRLDAALDAGLLLGALAARAGDRIALVAADAQVRARVGPTAGRDVLPRLVAAMTPLEPVLVETDARLLCAQVLQQVSRRSLVVLFADVGERLVDAVRPLVSRHVVVVASATDPALGRLAAGRDDADEVYVAGAAELARAARAAAAARLTALGAHVVEAPADLLGSKVADAYLDLKAAGRL